MIPEGEYQARAVTVDTEEYGPVWAQFGATETGTDQVAVTFEIISGPYKGERLTWFGYFTEKATERTIQALRYCGLKGDDIMLAMEQPIDQEVQITIKHDTYRGKTRAKINWINPPGGGGFKLKKSLDAEKRTELSQRLRGVLRSTPEHVAAPAPAAANGTPASDDEIPF